MTRVSQQMLSGDEMKEDEMGWECGTYVLWWRKLKQNSDDLYVDGRIILKWTFKK